MKCATANHSATAGSDYGTVPLTTLSFDPGQTSKTVTVTINCDTTVEPNETFLVNLSGAVNASIFDNQGIGKILNDDGAYLSINDVSVAEGHNGPTTLSFTVALSKPSNQVVTVQYATANGTATAPGDYVAKSGTLSFAPGVTTKTVAVTVNGDTAMEANESFVVNLSNPVNATLFDAQGIGTITNDDGVAAPQSAPLSPSEPSSSTQLNNASASASANAITLEFSDTVPDGFTVAVGGATVAIDDTLREGNTIALLLPDGSMRVGDAVAVRWNGGGTQFVAE